MLRLGILEEVETINFVLFEPSKIETSKSVIPVENNLFGAGRFGSTTLFLIHVHLLISSFRL